MDDTKSEPLALRPVPSLSLPTITPPREQQRFLPSARLKTKSEEEQINHNLAPFPTIQPVAARQCHRSRFKSIIT